MYFLIYVWRMPGTSPVIWVWRDPIFAFYLWFWRTNSVDISLLRQFLWSVSLLSPLISWRFSRPSLFSTLSITNCSNYTKFIYLYKLNWHLVLEDLISEATIVWDYCINCKTSKVYLYYCYLNVLQWYNFTTTEIHLFFLYKIYLCISLLSFFSSRSCTKVERSKKKNFCYENIQFVIRSK